MTGPSRWPFINNPVQIIKQYYYILWKYHIENMNPRAVLEVASFTVRCFLALKFLRESKNQKGPGFELNSVALEISTVLSLLF